MKYATTILCLILSLALNAQTGPDKYWVQFTDKNNSPYSIQEPSEYLSYRAIDRRHRYEIPVTEQDLPVNPAYIDSLLSVGVTVLHSSRWFNGVSIQTQDQQALEKILQFPFVSRIKSVHQLKVQSPSTKLETIESYSPQTKSAATDSTFFDYGEAAHQTIMLNGHIIHNQGFRGEGMIIAILDGGFTGVDQNPAFDSLWINNQILGHRDFVDGGPLTFTAHPHGSHVLSVMGANLPGTMVGSAPKASYYLLRTEEAATEYLIEEDNWVAGIEFADSAGADLVNSSLGYTVFDDPEMNHRYEDMDGNTTRITQAADIAASKGILVVTSASNEGNKEWKYIGAPADGDSVFTVGAVDRDGIYAPFSSIGPTYDGRIKPNVTALGFGTALVGTNGEVVFGSGTSFSSPLVCGLTACLWQANKNLTNMEVMSIIQSNSSQASEPDYYLGYGIPDYGLAFFRILGIDSFDLKENSIIRLYPNPFSSQLIVDYYTTTPLNFSLRIIDITGKICYHKDYQHGYNNLNRIKLNDLQNLDNGLYFLQIINEEEILLERILKQSY